ncbi:hypothetical protein Taro_015205 [Colocasia esculenta]|uniref:rhamnogalacturonan endolyase n=1 Tax=Colocasia esculenta TaxID=4460 RepID=A0A843UK87_COLES|nr:hypothetical protein [Colocasia esculenta]
MPPIGVNLTLQDRYVVVDNSILQVTLSKPEGMITGIWYNGVDNLMEILNKETDRGIQGTQFKVIMESEEQVELSFARTWDSSLSGSNIVPLSIDRRFVMLRGCSGFYIYAILEHFEQWPAFSMAEARAVFKLRKDKFHYMAMEDNRKRIMPMPDDRSPPRGKQLAYPEAVQLINPINPALKGEVDDKYQYSCNNEDNKVHGWICSDPPVGFWQITPSNEFRTGGPVKQDLTSHVGPICLAMFISTHYAGVDLEVKLKSGEQWKKVFGPVFIYLNSTYEEGDPRNILWEDAKLQMKIEQGSWPYSFPASEDFFRADRRGFVSGKLLVRDREKGDVEITAESAYVGLALPGQAGSWQRESKGYQFWTRTGPDGSFSIENICIGEYGLNAWVPGYIGDYLYDKTITITAGCNIDLGDLVYEPPRDGPTVWEMGIPDRSAREFYVPDPNPLYINKLYVNHPDRFRQYGLWERYTELYPKDDLVYTVGVSDYAKDWFYAHVNRKKEDNTYAATTWQIKFTLKQDQLAGGRLYKLRIALAAAKDSDLQVRINDAKASPPHFSTGTIGGDNSIARHGIAGLYWLFDVDVQNSWLVEGENIIFLTQARSTGPFQGVMYDYIRLEETQASDPRKKDANEYPLQPSIVFVALCRHEAT